MEEFSKTQRVNTKSEINFGLKKRGVGLIICGVLSFLLAGILNPIWGVLLIIVGALLFAIKNHYMFMATGCVLLLAGIMNLSSGITNGFWTAFGLLQIGWAIEEFILFGKHNRRLKEIAMGIPQGKTKG